MHYSISSVADSQLEWCTEYAFYDRALNASHRSTNLNDLLSRWKRRRGHQEVHLGMYMRYCTVDVECVGRSIV